MNNVVIPYQNATIRFGEHVDKELKDVPLCDLMRLQIELREELLKLRVFLECVATMEIAR